MLIDRFSPVADFREHHQIVLSVAPEVAFRAVYEMDLSESWVIRILFGLRGLPVRGPLSLPQMIRMGFVLLGEEAGHEIVLGLTGRFWRLQGDLRRVEAADFTDFCEPGYAKATWNFRVDNLDSGETRISTETRVVATDEASRRAFRRYWIIVRPFSGLIRRRVLAAVRRNLTVDR